MKVIVAGAGFVGCEVIRQCLSIPQITTVVALARKAVTAPPNLEPGSDPSKLQSLVIQDYSEWPDALKSELSGAAGCIWTVAITPTKSSMYDWDTVVRVCQTSTMMGLRAMYEAGPTKPFRFIYCSGFSAERDQTKTPDFRPRYSLLRGETESQVLAFAEEHKGEVEAAVTRPGLIKAPGNIIRNVGAAVARVIMSVPNLYNAEIAAAMLDQIINGFEKDTWLNDDLAALGKQVLEKRKEVQKS